MSISYPLATKKRAVWVYYYNDGARGFGHLGLMIEQKNGSWVRYSQGAINPHTLCIRIVIFHQRAKVEKKVFPPHTSPSFMAQNASLLRIPTQFPEQMEECIAKYILNNRPYHSMRNNCANFIAEALNAAEDVKVKSRILPCNLYKEIKLFLNQTKTSLSSLR